MKKNDSFYQLILAIAFIILGAICFIPEVNFLQYLICLAGIVIIAIGMFFFIKGLTREYSKDTRKYFIIGGLITIVVGILFSTLVWLLFVIFGTILGALFILYSIIGLIVVFKDKYGLKRVRILSTIKNIIYLAIGILLIIDCFYHQMLIDIILGIMLISDGVIGVSTYVSSYREYHRIFDVNEEEFDEEDKDKIIIHEEEHEN